MKYESINAYTHEHFDGKDIDLESVAEFLGDELSQYQLVRRFDGDYDWELLKVKE